MMLTSIEGLQRHYRHHRWGFRLQTHESCFVVMQLDRVEHFAYDSNLCNATKKNVENWMTLNNSLHKAKTYLIQTQRTDPVDSIYWHQWLRYSATYGFGIGSINSNKNEKLRKKKDPHML